MTSGYLEQPLDAPVQYQLVFVRYIRNGQLLTHMNHAEHLQDGMVLLGELFEAEIAQLIDLVDSLPARS